jgi:hypothetical protein
VIGRAHVSSDPLAKNELRTDDGRAKHTLLVSGDLVTRCDVRVVNQKRGLMKKSLRAVGNFVAQGDIILERVKDVPVSGDIIHPDPDGAVVLGRGEVTGHRHAFYGSNVTMFRDDAIARDMPTDLYIGHVKVEAPTALQHEEHSTLAVPPGTYRVRRQREWTAEMDRIVAD